MASIDLNCDLGESFGRYTLGLDDKVIPLISSCNVACGMHAGDPCVAGKTVRLAAEAGIAIGAHPGYPDLVGFGRRDLNMTPDDAYDYVVYQVGALSGICAANGVLLRHVKPHGQMYNRAAVDMTFAEAIASAVKDVDSSLVLVGLSGGCLIDAGKAAGLKVANEFFADRNYTPEGKLAPRSLPNAVITDEDFAAQRLVRVIEEGSFEAVDGSVIEVAADTICVHGDNEHALQFVMLIREKLAHAGIEILPVQ